MKTNKVQIWDDPYKGQTDEPTEEQIEKFKNWLDEIIKKRAEKQKLLKDKKVILK